MTALRIDVLLTEADLAEEFLSGLERRYLPEILFYWFPLSVRAWLDLCRGEQPYRNYSRSRHLVAKHAAEIALRFGAGAHEVVSLGSGQGDKDLLLLQALREKGASVRYRPVDSSQALLERAVAGAAGAGFDARGLKADVGRPRTAGALADADAPRLYLVLGNSIGVIDPLAFLRELRALLRPEDRLLLDGEIFEPGETLAGYDNPTNRRFAFAPLSSLGLEDGRDGDLVFGSEADPRRGGLHVVSKHFRAGRRLRVPVAGRWIEMDAGERIAMNGSYKFSRAAFLGMIREEGAFEPLDEYRTDDRGFLMVLAAPAAR
ncbi:MAG: L-histidine N(alpha)-methyltransferase [Acidobacteria bacterium]|nr:L-histidine N(alpha)-methyltransferase [Acidobacteriota bacterium]